MLNVFNEASVLQTEGGYNDAQMRDYIKRNGDPALVTAHIDWSAHPRLLAIPTDATWVCRGFQKQFLDQ